MQIESPGLLRGFSACVELRLSCELAKDVLLRRFEIGAGQGTTNVAFGPAEKDLYITVVTDPNDPKARGSIVRIPNR